MDHYGLLNNLTGSASDPAQPAAEDETKVPVSPEIDTPPAPVSDNVTIAHKKVINPPDSSPKPDIQALYAKEQAEATTGEAAPKPVVADDKGPKAAPEDKASDQPDPNSITL